MSNFQLRFQEVIGTDEAGDPIGSEPVVLAESNETKPKELQLIMADKIKAYDEAGISRDSYVIWTTATPPERKAEH